jgi:hypothetical protein
MITQKNAQAGCSLFPSSFFYSFENSDLWLSLTFLPSTEVTTQVRYDIFNPSSKASENEKDLTNAVEGVIKDLIQATEIEYRSIHDRPIENSQSTRQILQTIQEHSKLEKMHGGLILPAMHQPKGSSLFQQAEQRRYSALIIFRSILTKI